MLTIKNRLEQSVVAVSVAVLLLAGCRPPGVGELLQGKRLMEAGKYPQAIEALKVATDTPLLHTNAQAWNYLGLAYHCAGETANAEKAYQRALALDHDLSEARFNLGCLWLDQNRLDSARTEFTAYTLRRGNSVDGLLKLGAVQLRSRDPMAAEASFKEVLRLNPQNPEALNGMGLARCQRGRGSEAAQFFTNALKQQPNYRPALLNLAIVSQQYLKDRQLALQKYREYLASKPLPANAEGVAAIVRQLEQELNPPTHVVASSPAPQVRAGGNTPKPAVTNVVRAPNGPKVEAPTSLPKQAPTTPPPPPTQDVEVVRLPAEAVFKSGQDVSPPPTGTPLSAAESSTSAGPEASNAPKRSLLQRMNPLNLFAKQDSGSARPTSSPGQPALPGGNGNEAITASRDPSAQASSYASSNPGRYAYLLPARLAPGNRPEAERTFSQGVQAQKARRLTDAVQAYRQATQMDPDFFEAYYNLGLAAAESGKLREALPAYEHALAIQPDSLDARYNFALVLRQAGYAVDAANELEKILVRYPNETRVHLALGNLYAQQMRQPGKARPHYLKVLEAEPQHPQAGAIRYWLVDNH